MASRGTSVFKQSGTKPTDWSISRILLIGSPMCSAFGQLQSLNRHRMAKRKFDELLENGSDHLRFFSKLYPMQMDNGLYFLDEHPAEAKSWEDPMVQRLPNDWRAYSIKGNGIVWKQ